jgi:hypothetical protein
MVGLIFGVIAGAGVFFLLTMLPVSVMTVSTLKIALCVGAGIAVMGLMKK